MFDNAARRLGLDPTAVSAVVPQPLHLLREPPADPDTATWGRLADAGDLVWWVAGDPALLLIGLGPTVVLAEPAVVWHGQVPVLVYRDPASGPGDEPIDWFRAHARRLIARRRSRFRRCRECGLANPPEWRWTPSLCQSCATANHGVVF